MKQLYLLILLISQFCLAQNNVETYHTAFDGLVKSYTSDLNTGERFEDLYPTINNLEFRFLESSKSTIGSVRYNEQSYYKRLLKYDLFDDNILIFCEDVPNGYDIILDISLVNSFSIYDRDFTKLPIEASAFSFYRNGYFEIITGNESFDLYVKHYKTNLKKLGDKNVYYIYSKGQAVILKYNSIFYEINSKNGIIKILKNRKKDIKWFYKNYSYLERNNEIEFYNKLFNYLFKNY